LPPIPPHEAEPGDIVYLDRPWQHYALLVAQDDPQSALVIAGNIRDGKSIGYQLLLWDELACFSIGRLVDCANGITTTP